MEQPITFPVGDITLEGLLSRPSQAAGNGVVVCHPHPLRGGEMRNNVVTALVDGFRTAGMATLRFNFRGVGKSGGIHDDGRAELDDVTAAVTCLLDHHAVSTVVVAGYSFGSIVGLAAGARDPRVHKLIGVALPIANRDVSFLHAVTKPAVLISGDRDDFSPATKLRLLVDQCPEFTSLRLIDGADHFFGGQEGRVAEAAVGFLAG